MKRNEVEIEKHRQIWNLFSLQLHKKVGLRDKSHLNKQPQMVFSSCSITRHILLFVNKYVLAHIMKLLKKSYTCINYKMYNRSLEKPV